MTHSIEITSIDNGIDEKLKNLDNSIHESCTIFKVNVWLSESNQNAYTPKMVSIGPYHEKNSQLHPMNKYKWLYLRQFLKRKGGLDGKSCISELEKLKEKALKCYDDVKCEKFCEMLLLDGCFVVEFIRECNEKLRKSKDKIINDNIVGYIIRDLLLLENQLPFFVLNKLHDMTKGDGESPLGELASIISVPFFDKYPEPTTETSLEITGDNIKHLLHLKHAISCHGTRMKKPKATELSEAKGCYNIKNKLHLVCRHLGLAGNGKDNDDQTWHMVMQNATKLSEAGVSFKKVNVAKTELSKDGVSFEKDNVATTELSKDGVSFEKDNVKTTLFDSIEFKKGLMKILCFTIPCFTNPCFTIPCFKVEDSTETILRNLIAYEQQLVDVQPKYFSNFAVIMDKLIESDKDVNLLCQQGIIENWLGDDKEVANLFNKIGNGVVITDRNFYYEEECRKAVKHCKKPWNKLKANLLRNYFSSLWVGTSTMAATVLLILTCIQTIPVLIDLFN